MKNYLIIAHSRLTGKNYTYGYIMPWWWKKRLEKTTSIFNQDVEFNKNILFRVITEKEYLNEYKGIQNYTDYIKLLVSDMFKGVENHCLGEDLDEFLGLKKID